MGVLVVGSRSPSSECSSVFLPFIWPSRLSMETQIKRPRVLCDDPVVNLLSGVQPTSRARTRCPGKLNKLGLCLYAILSSFYEQRSLFFSFLGFAIFIATCDSCSLEFNYIQLPLQPVSLACPLPLYRVRA
jgi:hypothetical protein